jgi:hypothetical protein
MRGTLRLQASRRLTCVETWTTENWTPARSMRESASPWRWAQIWAMYSVWPVKARPERVTASLLRGAVTMALASPSRHILVAVAT